MWPEAESDITDEDLMMWGSICVNNWRKSQSLQVVMTMDSGSLKPGVQYSLFMHVLIYLRLKAFGESHYINLPSLFLNSRLAHMKNQTLSSQKDLKLLHFCELLLWVCPWVAIFYVTGCRNKSLLTSTLLYYMHFKCILKCILKIWMLDYSG